MGSVNIKQGPITVLPGYGFIEHAYYLYFAHTMYSLFSIWDLFDDYS